MQARWQRVSRRPPWPLWAVIVVGVWAALGAAAVLLGRLASPPAALCPLKRLTGLPCPTCGFARGCLAVLAGRLLDAWLNNPLLFSVLAVLTVATTVRVVFGRRVRIELTRAERGAAWLLAVGMVLGNWAYLIRCVG